MVLRNKAGYWSISQALMKTMLSDQSTCLSSDNQLQNAGVSATFHWHTVANLKTLNEQFDWPSM